MPNPGMLYTNAEIMNAIEGVKNSKTMVQVLFNQGKFIYQSILFDYDEKHLHFDFDGIEETTLMSMIDFYSATVFVFFDKDKRHQFLAKQSLITNHLGRTSLKIAIPSNINVVPGRQSDRLDVPESESWLNASIQGEAKAFPIRDISEGGFSMWAQSSFGLAPHSVVKNCQIQFADGQSFFCSIEIIRMNYTLDDPMGRTHIISCKFEAILEKDFKSLVKRLAAKKAQSAAPTPPAAE